MIVNSERRGQHVQFGGTVDFTGARFGWRPGIGRPLDYGTVQADGTIEWDEEE